MDRRSALVARGWYAQRTKNRGRRVLNAPTDDTQHSALDSLILFFNSSAFTPKNKCHQRVANEGSR